MARRGFTPVVGKCAVVKPKHNSLKPSDIISTTVSARLRPAPSLHARFYPRTFTLKGLKHLLPKAEIDN
jgi:hypothetical protein